MTSEERLVWRIVEVFARRELQSKKCGDVKGAAHWREIIETILREFRGHSLEPEGE